MAANDPFEYDVVLSFAGEDRAVAEEFANMLRAKDIKVLYDEYQAAELGGSNFVTHIAELYRTKARYCVLLLSQYYPLKKWTEADRTAAQEHALRDANEHVIPMQIDHTEVPGTTEASGYLESTVNLLEQKLTETKSRSGPPPQSHDLRSGNIPIQRSKSDDQ